MSEDVKRHSQSSGEGRALNGDARSVPRTDCFRCPLRATGAFAPVSTGELEFIFRFKHRELELRRGALLVKEGHGDGELYTLLAGWAFRFRTLSGGRRQILNFLLPGDFLGLQEKLGGEFQSGVELLTDARVCCFRLSGLWNLFREHPSLGYDVTWLAAHEELIVDENLVSVGQRTAQQRLAMLLIHLYRRAEAVGLCDADGSIPFPLSQRHMSDALGLSLVHTNKSLRALARLGLHVLEQGRLRLTNPRALQAIADYWQLPLRERPLL